MEELLLYFENFIAYVQSAKQSIIVVRLFGGKKRIPKNIIIADAVDMRIIDNYSYDFWLSSNNLEYIENPLKALHEFCRIVKPGGFILIIVPNEEKIFNH